MIDKLTAHWRFTRMPFGKDLAPSMLHRHSAHAQAVARITWCIGERALGVITGEVGAGKTVAVRASLAQLDHPRHKVIYLANSAVGVAGIHHAIVTSLGGVPRPHKSMLSLSFIQRAVAWCPPCDGWDGCMPGRWRGRVPRHSGWLAAGSSSRAGARGRAGRVSMHALATAFSRGGF